jgi:L-rhamnono-1,4-lactonase
VLLSIRCPADRVTTDHLCKPDLTIINPTDPSFIAWRTAMFTLSKCKQTYMKLSGAFSEMPDTLARRDSDDIFMAIYPWLAVALAAFSPSRLMFGSDWPVSTLGVGTDAWTKWQKVVARMCYSKSISQSRMLFRQRATNFRQWLLWRQKIST